MVYLEEIAAVANILKMAPASTVQLLHKIVNEKPYSKSSRKEFKKFAGFPQNHDIEARKDKILKDFTKTELITVCTILRLNSAGCATELSELILKNLSDLASLKHNFTEQLMDDEDEYSVPFSLESTNDANKQPLAPSIYHSPSSQDVFALLLQTQRNQSQRWNEENAFLLKDLFLTMRSFTGNDNYSVKAFFRDVKENFIFIPHISDLQNIICVKRLLQGPAKTFIQTLLNTLSYSSLKAALIEDLFCSYDVHKEMPKRKLRPTESLFEYFLAMREIVSKAHFRLDD
ncbi:transposon Tf2-9 polyprotein [Trichonephila clavipes]|nr:transposon Tf2-9 polyprotein [Trichonephila clavipes]